MVRRMIVRGLLLAPVVVAGPWLLGGGPASLSAGLGVVLVVLNLALAGRIIGGVAENRPDLLMAAAMAALTVGLVLVVVAAQVLEQIRIVDFAITGVVFAGGHLALVTWEAADAFLKIDSTDRQDVPAPPNQGAE